MIPPAAGTLGPMSPAKTKTNPRGLGRPPSTGETASVNVTFRLTPTESAAYKAAANAAGVTLGDWIRAACAARLPKRKAKR